MRARQLRRDMTLIDHGHRFRVTQTRTYGWPWNRRTRLTGHYEPTGAPATYVYPANHEVETTR